MEENKLINNSTIIKTAISNYAFINRENLTDIILPDNIKSIGERAFAKCKNLRKITLPESLKYIGASVFSECENLKEIILPKNLKKLNYRTFGDYKRLKRIVIPEGKEELDWGVFAGCDNLEYVVFNNVESSFNYRDDESLLKIYKAFLRGSKAFTETYNKNNLDHPITKISIGTKRNTILKYLTDQNSHPEILVQKSLKFGEYSLNGSGYAGDRENKTKISFKKGVK